MIEVRIYLEDEYELEGFQLFSDALVKHRRALQEARDKEWREQMAAQTNPVPNPEVVAEPVTTAHIGQALREAAERVPLSAPTAPTQTQLEDALRAYGQAKGFPAARALLDEYTKGKLGDVPAEKRAELYARLTA